MSDLVVNQFNRERPVYNSAILAQAGQLTTDPYRQIYAGDILFSGVVADLGTGSGSTAFNADLGRHKRLVADGNVTLQNPTTTLSGGFVDGDVIAFDFTQDGTGSHTLTFDTEFSTDSVSRLTLTPSSSAGVTTYYWFIRRGSNWFLFNKRASDGSESGSGGITALSVSNIDDPSTELNSIAGTGADDVRLCYQTVAGTNEWTLYVWDNADSNAENVPYTVDGSSGMWKALTGKYVDGTINFTSIDVTNAEVDFGTYTDQSTPANPAAGKIKVYSKAGKLTQLESDGTETNLTEGGGGTSSEPYTETFTHANLTSGTIQIEHNRGVKYCHVVVSDENDNEVSPDKTFDDENNTTLNFGTDWTWTGNYTVSVQTPVFAANATVGQNWTAYTPDITSGALNNISLNNFEYLHTDRFCYVRGQIVCTGTAGGIFKLGLPSGLTADPPSGLNSGMSSFMGGAILRDISEPKSYRLFCDSHGGDNTHFRLFVPEDDATYTDFETYTTFRNNYPIPLASGDNIDVFVCIPVAQTGVGNVALTIETPDRHPKIENDATDADADIKINPGAKADTTYSKLLELDTALIKQIDAVFAEGTNAGGRASAVSLTADTWYYVYMIEKTSDGTIDVYFDTSSSAANIPSGYGKYALIGWVLTDSSSDIRRFNHYPEMRKFIWNDASQVWDLLDTTPPTSNTNKQVMSVPPNTTGILRQRLNSNASNDNMVVLPDDTGSVFYPILRAQVAGQSIDGYLDIEVNSSSEVVLYSSTSVGTFSDWRLTALGWRY